MSETIDRDLRIQELLADNEALSERARMSEASLDKRLKFFADMVIALGQQDEVHSESSLVEYARALAGRAQKAQDLAKRLAAALNA